MPRRPSGAPAPGVWSDVPFLAVIALIALAIRLYRPWAIVFEATHLNMLETDGWYHLRTIEYFVHNFPHHVTDDPYVGGQYVAMAPFFDIAVGTSAWIAGLGHPSAALIGRVAALAPPIFGVLTVIAVYFAGRAFDSGRAGLLAAALAAILPGHFLDRTLLGFVDHHALEALLSTVALTLLLYALKREAKETRWAVALGVVLAAYMLTWTSAAFLAGLIAVWVVVAQATDFFSREPSGRVARVAAIGGGTAFVLVWLLQDRRLYRRDMQLLALALIMLAGASLEAARRIVIARGWNPRWIPIAMATAVAAVAIAYPLLQPEQWDAIWTDLVRFTPSADRMQVIEARPLFLFNGAWSLDPIWSVFRSGFIVGLVALAALLARTIRRPSARDLLLVIWAVWMYLATLGQNRFGYYLVPIAAILGGWLSSTVIDVGRRNGGAVRSLAVTAVAALVFAPSLVPAVWTTGRPSGLPAPWVPAFEWLRTSTPEPFGDPAYYTARYASPARAAAFTVMDWWDNGYWVAQIAHRVPVANPTQAGADVAGRFYSATSEDEAVAVLDRQRARYVIAEEALAFRPDGPSALYGKFESIVAFAGQPTSRYYEQFFVVDAKGVVSTQFLFFADYYQSMAFRLVGLGGTPAIPRNSTSVVSWVDRTLPGSNTTFRQATEIRDFETYEGAVSYLQKLGPGSHRLVGRSPMLAAVPVDGLSRIHRVYATPSAGWFPWGAVQVFERAP